MSSKLPSDGIAAINRFAERVGEIIQQSPAADLSRNARAQFVAKLAKQGLVTREEFELQAALLAKSRDKLKALEEKIAALEAERR